MPLDLDGAAALLTKVMERDPETGSILVMLLDEVEQLQNRIGSGEGAHPMLIQLRGGITDPREDQDHPGRYLLKAGWTYHGPDAMGCEWSHASFDDGARKSLAFALADLLHTLAT